MRPHFYSPSRSKSDNKHGKLPTDQGVAGAAGSGLELTALLHSHHEISGEKVTPFKLPGPDPTYRYLVAPPA